MSHSVLDPGGIPTLKYIITHVFCPLQLPDRVDSKFRNNHSLAKAVVTAARLYSGHVDQAHLPRWNSILRMLANLQAISQSESQNLDSLEALAQFNNMDVGDVLTLHVRAQNAGVLFRKLKDVTIFEAFELSPRAEDVINTLGKLICSYPGPAIEIPNYVFNDKDFLSELVNFLVHMNHDVLNAETSRKEEGQEVAFQDTVHPRYITELLTGILRGIGRPANITRISKRVGDDVVCNNSKLPWRRSSLWLLIRVSLQTTLDRSPLGHHTYKEFMLFFMCCLGVEKACADLPSDFLHCMSAKINRRLRKLGSSMPDWLPRTVLQTCTFLRSIIEDRWNQVQATQCLSTLWTPSQLDLTRDIRLSLSRSRHYLLSILNSDNVNLPNVPFFPEHHPRGTLDDFLSSDGDFFEESYRIEPHITLYDVERAVEQGIDTWVGQVMNNDEACVKLEILAHKYSTSALKTYGNNPELLSVMVLTTIELWVALDKIVVKEIPMHADYSPEVPTSFLEHLLLCKTANLHRLRLAYEYISRRHSQSRSGWSAFSSTTTANSFAVRFYRKSSHLRRLKIRIKKIARVEFRKAVAELEKRNARYAEPQNLQVQNLEGCLSCQWADNVCNWPLSAKQQQLEAEVVFELDCPVTFSIWRTATFHLLVDLCSPFVQRDVSRMKLDQYRVLRTYLVKHPKSPISVRSNDRSTFFDTRTAIPVSEVLGRGDSKHCCTYKLPKGPYHNLQKYIDSTSHTSNEVMANQADCHKDLFIHEYMAFGHMRSGGLLQWLNVLRELRGRSLSFRHHEVHMLLAQAVSQVGPLVNTEWIWHQEIQQSTFCCALLGELQSLARDIEASWLEGVTMNTISFLLRRLLASSSDKAVSLEALGLLRAVRGKVFSWVQELSARVIKTPGDEELRGVLRDIAAICRSTFDVDPAIVPKFLHSADDIDILLSCAILIHDHLPSDVSRLTAYSKLLLDRDRRLSLALERHVSEIIQAYSSEEGINLAVRRIWPTCYPGSMWIPMQAPNSHWFSCMTAPPADQHPQKMHFNILDGSLLVNEKPFGSWLPNEFVHHPLYRLIFGEKTLTVTESDLPGMNYATRELISDYQASARLEVHFSLRNSGSDLVIRAKRKRTNTGDSEIIELIPPKKLEGDLPAVLIDGHAHWLNLSTSVMEIRPLDNLWEHSSENWEVDCTLGKYRMWKGNQSFVDIRSQSWGMISSVLQPLGTPQDLIITVSPTKVGQPTSSSLLQLSVLLPRYDLSFYVDEDGDLQSHNIRGMVYDANQSIGTLFGLVNQLVLRPKIKDIHSVVFIPRCVIIPDGKVSFDMDGHHVRVEITPDRSVVKRVTYQMYTVNSDLGCLTGNGTLTSKLYCAYLHALTSGCSVDPLTGRSGTEEAASVLRSAGCCSTTLLNSRDAVLLSLIASLYPSQTWYLKNFVQKVEWRNLPAISQNYELYSLSNAIMGHYQSVQRHDGGQSSAIFQRFPLQNDHSLGIRSARQAAYLFPFEFSGKPSGVNFDVQYPSRDMVEAASGEHRAYIAATFVHRRTATATKNIWGMVGSWEEMSGYASSSLQYDRSWLAPNLPSTWFTVYNRLRESDKGKWFQMLFSLPAMVYASSHLSELVPVFVAFASHSQFRSEDPPHYIAYPISEGYCPSLHMLRHYVVTFAYPLERSPEGMAPQKPKETPGKLKKRQREMFDNRRDLDARATAQALLDAWPSETCPPCSLNPDLYDVANVESKTQSLFSSCFRNLKLKEHLTRVQTILNNLRFMASPITDTPYFFQPSQNIPACIPWLVTLDQLFTRPAPPLQAGNILPRYAFGAENTSRIVEAAPLYQLIATVETDAANPFQRRYVSALRTSSASFGREMSLVAHGATKRRTTETLPEHYIQCRARYIDTLHLLQRHLGPRSQSEQGIERSGQWPRITAHTLFRYLASNSPIALPSDWKKCLVRFALLALELQRARRLLLLHFDNRHEEFCRELQNEGCDGWDAEAHPDWLLIQLQCNFLIRRVQAEVANEMISPQSGDNTTMQLNMGEGKSSVIVPMAAIALANGNQLVRVIVPKPLTPQILHLLADRLGGLTNRRIYHLPFSRSFEVNNQNVTSLHQIMVKCMKEGGILVLQPEHILSLRLVSVERQLSRTEDGQVGHLLLELQKWLHAHSRDILDESDEILDVRSQLVFTMGDQRPVEGSPERWTTTEHVLSLVNKHASSLRELFPLGVEYEPGPPGSFPYLRILQVIAGGKLISWIVEDVIDGHLPNISFAQSGSTHRDAIRSFISYEDVPLPKVRLVKESFGSIWSNLLLLRGLLANGILLFAFRERRWRVDYGLAPTRTMLAVPYRAKDVPSQKAEFGHLDIAIILTCLSYYYPGLTEEQLRLSFEILFEQQVPSLHYDIWVRACPALPESLQTLRGVNIDSLEQWNKSLYPLFSRNQATIDFYLSNVVFPREVKEFPSKLSSSGWDLAEKKDRVLTGFSGTNDGQYLLPLDVAQRDPDHQRGTNAKVLSYLLQPENNHYMCMAYRNGKRRTTREFLEILVAQKPKIRVLLDVGAQMLGLQNYELAKAWLDISPDASAAVYVSEEDELMVYTRDGSKQLLRSSPFAQQLDRCVVYLDDAHTRGTDIKFPSGFRAAVTLGPKVTKDRLVQGCMRMRKLGQDHSIMFFAPLDVDRHIRSVAGKDQDSLDVIDTMDILHWVIRVTWDHIQRWTPHWLHQGMDHASRYAAWTDFCGGQLASKQLARKWLQPETKKLDELYEPRNYSNPVFPPVPNPDHRQWQRCIDLGVLSLSSVGMDEEQEREREVVHELKRKRTRKPNAERPSRVLPATHLIHHDVVDFIKTGAIPTRTQLFRARTKAFCPIFETLDATSAATDEPYIWSQSVLATTDFQETVKGLGEADDYLRPVHWIVSAKRDTNDVLVILSPYEVNSLLPDIRSSNKVHLHLYTPRIMKSMKPCDDLALYSIPAVPDGWISPSSFMDELSVFAGQLYMKDYDTYIRLCRFLCVYTRELQGEERIIVEPDGFILPVNRAKLSRIQIAHTFSSTPIVALKALMDLRSKDNNYRSTHMGRLVHGHLLSESDFDD